MDQVERQKLWAQFAAAALSGYQPPDEIDEREIVDDAVEYSAAAADELLDEYASRFAEAPRRRPRRGKPRERE